MGSEHAVAASQAANVGSIPITRSISAGGLNRLVVSRPALLAVGSESLPQLPSICPSERNSLGRRVLADGNQTCGDSFPSCTQGFARISTAEHRSPMTAYFWSPRCRRNLPERMSGIGEFHICRL